ncbi:TonB-dependent receptor [uncultured Parabacteroides sp.]|uniref:TonB-dependent receptor n=2 Tax=uncultured Parabacteroides sp. TaxID=512312 RepID=UPI0035A62210
MMYKKLVGRSLILALLLSGSLSVGAQKITQQFRNVPLKTVLKEVEKQLQYSVIYKKDEVNENKQITHNFKDASVEDVLSVILDNGLSYSIQGKMIVISQKGATVSVSQQKKKVTGVVKDKTGEPVIGANVIERGTTNGTVTDLDGRFTLEVPQNAVLQVSYIGYMEQEIPVNNRNDIPVSLLDDTQNLDEIVVVGYGTQKKVNLTGAVSSVKAEVLENRTTSDPVNMLTGNVSGVTIVQNAGQPGADGAALRVRGVGTLGNSEAMVIIDGVESSMSNVDPNDIENISVLKDAAAASIYGVRAANGVVLITTKRGAVGKPVISYNGYVGWQQATRLPKYLDSYNYAVLLNEAYKNDGLEGLYNDTDLQKFKDGSDPDHFANSDWLDALFSENGLFHNHHLSVNGGSEAIKYSLSFGYHNKEGLMPNTDYNKFNVRSNLDAKINDRLNVSLNLSAYRSRMAAPSSGVIDIMYYAFRETPVTPIRFQNGNYGLFKNEHNSVASARESGLARTYNNNFQGSASFTYKILEGLSLRGNASTTFNLKDEHTFLRSMKFYTADSTDPIRTTRSSVENKDNKMLEVNLQAYLDYTKSFGKHDLKGLLGYSQLYNQYRILGASRKDLPLNNSLGEINAGDVTTQATEGNKIEYALRSAFARVNYTFDNRYLLEANLRYDGTSRFPKDNRFGAFPSFSAGWRMSEESFFTASWIDNLKFRASWGQLGNQEIGDYAFYNTYMFGQDYNFGNMLYPGISINDKMANSIITWEKTDQIDVGVDADAFGGKLSFTGDFFIKNTRDILLELPIPEIVGVKPPMQNAGKVRNTGMEMQISHNNQINDFKYYATFNFSYVHNEITDLSGGDTPGRSVGDPINNIYGYVCEGIFRDQADIDAHPTQIWGAKPGDLKYKDLNNDNKIDENDRQSLGTYFPKINFGLRLGFEYKNFDFSALMQGAGMVDAIVKAEINKAFYNGGKVTEYHLDRWTPDNLDATYPRLSMKDSKKNWMTSTFWMQNASYLKMRNMQIGYSLPKRVLADSGITRLRVYFSVDNLFTITGFDGVDPESAYNMKDLSVSSSYYPLTRNYSFGVNLSF